MTGIRLLCPVILFAGFFLICIISVGTDRKNIKNFRSYPAAVQNQIRKIPHLYAEIPEKKPAAFSFIANMTVFAIVFFLINQICQFSTFHDAFLYDLISGEGLNLFDLLIIDALWWRHTKRIRFTEIPDPQDYQDLTPHVRSFLRAAVMFVLSALIAAVISSHIR